MKIYSKYQLSCMKTTLYTGRHHWHYLWTVDKCQSHNIQVRMVEQTGHSYALQLYCLYNSCRQLHHRRATDTAAQWEKNKPENVKTEWQTGNGMDSWTSSTHTELTWQIYGAIWDPEQVTHTELTWQIYGAIWDPEQVPHTELTWQIYGVIWDPEQVPHT